LVKSDVGYFGLSIKEMEVQRKNRLAGRKENPITKGFAVPNGTFNMFNSIFLILL